MADIEISQFPTVVGALTGNEFIPVLQGGVNKKAAISQIQTVTSGFGTMSLQNADNVSITGGSISGSTVTGTVAVINGGTGLTDVPTNGKVLIGNGVDFDLNTLTAGSGVTITNGAGVITIEAAGSGGTVTSVGGTGTVNGITLTGTVTTTGSLTLGGTLSNVSLTTQVTGTLPVGNGGTGATTLTGVIIGNGASAFTTVTAPSGTIVGTTDTQTLTNKTLTQPINAQIGTTYELVLADASKLVTLSNGSPIALTIPTNTNQAFAIGASVDLAQIGAGQVTVAGDVGVTVNATPGLKFRAQYSAASVVKLGTNTWILVGDLSA
jgi:hypothetical protein